MYAALLLAIDNTPQRTVTNDDLGEASRANREMRVTRLHPSTTLRARNPVAENSYCENFLPCAADHFGLGPPSEGKSSVSFTLSDLAWTGGIP